MKVFLSSLALTALLFSGCAGSVPVREAREKSTTYYEETPSEPEKRDPAEPFIIRSPFGKHRRMDLTGMEPGTKVQDPITGGIFRVPTSKDEEPEIVSEPPADWHPEE